MFPWAKYFRELNARFDKFEDRFSQQDKDVDNRLDNIEKVLIAQEMNLQEHMKRSDHLEDLVEEMQKKNDAAVAPLKKHINMVEGVFKFIGLMGILVSILGGLAKLFNMI